MVNSQVTIIMPDQSYFIYSQVSKLFSKIWSQGGLTASDRQRLMFALLKTPLCEEELSTIDRILRAAGCRSSINLNFSDSSSRNQVLGIH